MVITRWPSLVGVHHKVVITRWSSPGVHHKVVITRWSSLGVHHHCQVSTILSQKYKLHTGTHICTGIYLSVNSFATFQCVTLLPSFLQRVAHGSDATSNLHLTGLTNGTYVFAMSTANAAGQWAERGKVTLHVKENPRSKTLVQVVISANAQTFTEADLVYMCICICLAVIVCACRV